MVGDVLETAATEMYDDNEFEEEEGDDSERYAPQAPQGKKSGLSRADVLKEAAQIVQREEDREAEVALKTVSRNIGDEICKAKELSDDDEDDEDYGNGNLSNADKELQFACYHGVTSDCRRALRNGGSIMKRDKHGWLPIHWAAAHGHEQIIDVLLESTSIDTEKKKLKYINAQESITGFTPLHLSSIGGHLKCLDVLLTNGADYKIKNDQGESAAEMLSSKLSKKEATSNIGHHVMIRLNPDILKVPENLSGDKDAVGVIGDENHDGNNGTRK